MKNINGKIKEEIIKKNYLVKNDKEFLKIMIEEEEKKNTEKMEIKDELEKISKILTKKLLKKDNKKMYLIKLLKKSFLNLETNFKIDNLLVKIEKKVISKNEINSKKKYIDELSNISDNSFISNLTIKSEFKEIESLKKNRKRNINKSLKKLNKYIDLENSRFSEKKFRINSNFEKNSLKKKFNLNIKFFDEKIKKELEKAKLFNLSIKSERLTKDHMRKTDGFKKQIEKRKIEIEKLKNIKENSKKEKERENKIFLNEEKLLNINKNLEKIKKRKEERILKKSEKRLNKKIILDFNKKYINKENNYYSNKLKKIKKPKIDFKKLNLKPKSLRKNLKKVFRLPMLEHKSFLEKKRNILKEKLKKISTYSDYVKKTIVPRIGKKRYISEFKIKKEKKKKYKSNLKQKIDLNKIKNKFYLNYSIQKTDRNLEKTKNKNKFVFDGEKRYYDFLSNNSISQKYKNYLPFIKVKKKKNNNFLKLKNCFSLLENNFDKNQFNQFKEEIEYFDQTDNIKYKDCLTLIQTKINVLNTIN